MPEGEGSLVSGRQAIERGAQHREPIGVVDAIDIVDGDPIMETIRRPTGSVTAAPSLSSMMISELVRRDPKEPRSESSRLPAKPVEPGERTLEGDRREILREFAVTTSAIDVAMNGSHMAAIQLGKRVRISPRLFDELTLVEQTRVLHVVSHCPPA